MVVASGCGDASNTVSVDGQVTYAGSALPGGSVTFFPTSGRPVNAPIASDGNYNIEVAPGDYVVTVTYSEPLPPGYKEGDPIPAPKIELPAEYSTRAKSTLSATVAADQSEPIDFELK
jgi:hypothetical protein